MQHIGDLVIDDTRELHGQITGTTYVGAGGRLISYAQHCGGLFIAPGGAVVLYGQSARNVVNNGELELYGQVCGQIIGSDPTNELQPNQIIGTDLPVPFIEDSTSRVKYYDLKF